MTTTAKQKWADLAERAVFTLLETGLALQAVELLDIPKTWAVPIAGLLAVIKSALAAKLSENGTAAVMPAELDSPAIPAGRHAAPEGGE